ncbi:MAG: FAD-dependent oxidoreductase, partial [Gammaproteobacteria bacterium]|nr:FAD-dependent oxidoreductase [Gammaproteobacteria bacterium]
MKIGVVGTGIAGNVVAYRLAQDHDVTVFEANDYVGGHSNTVEINTPNGRLALDTGFIVFNDRTYPNFIALLDELGVESQESSMSFSVQCERTALEYNGATLNTLFAQRKNLLRPGFHRMIRDILRFNREALTLLDGMSPDLSLAGYLREGSYSREFVEHYLIPMGAAIWSAKPDMMREMPAHFFVRFFHNHGLLTLKDRPVWRVIRGGSQRYVEKLVAGHANRIRLRTPVRGISRTPRSVTVLTDGEAPESF